MQCALVAFSEVFIALLNIPDLPSTLFCIIGFNRNSCDTVDASLLKLFFSWRRFPVYCQPDSSSRHTMAADVGPSSIWCPSRGHISY